MGDGSLRCVDCQGRLGKPEAEQRCGLCLSLYRLRDLVLSERFPAIGSSQIGPLVRTAYWTALELTEAYHRAQQGGENPPSGEGGGKHPDKSSGSAPGLAPKAKPPSPPSNRRSPPSEKVHKKKDKKDKSEKKDQKDHKRRRRSPSPLKRKKRSVTPESPEEVFEEIEEAEEEVRVEDRCTSPPPRDSRKTRDGRSGGRDRSRERTPRRRSPDRSPLRPRSPDGPPPVRRNSSRSNWEGPIPAFHNRPIERPPLQRRKPKNKGAKKRRQQRRFKRNRHLLAARRRP